jgi:hypothetical protein
MKRSLLFLVCISSLISLKAQLVGVELEVFAELDGLYENVDGTFDDLTGFKTYRLYAVCENEADFVINMSGTENTPLFITTTTSFYQNPFGANLGSNINPGFYPFSEGLIYDSWVTIGKESNADAGEPTNTVGDTWIQNFAAGGDIVMNDITGGAWFLIPNPGNQPVNGLAGADLRVLIGQFTTDGDIVGSINVQVFLEGLNTQSVNYNGLSFTSIEGAVLGCDDPEATNYDDEVTVNDGSCIYPCALSAEINITQPLCPNSTTGSFVINASGAQQGAFFQLGNGNVLINSTYNNVPVGVYDLTVSDGVGCEVVYEVAIVQPTAITFNTAVTPVSCNGEGDGMITGSASGGTGAFTYGLNASLDPSSEVLEFTDLTPGTYVVYAVDGNGCTAQTGNLSVIQPPAISGGFVGGTLPATCHDSADGLLNVSFFGGAGGFTFSIDGENFAPGSVISAPPGTYTVYAQDANGCIAQTNSTATVGGPAPIGLDLELLNPTCFGDTDGALSGEAAGGNGGYVYTIDGEEGEDALIAEGLAGGVYTIEVVDSEGCTATFEAIIVDATEIELSLSADNLLCFGDEDGVIVAIAEGGTGELSFSFDGGDFELTNEFDGLGAGEYSVIVSDENGCQVVASLELTEPTALTANSASTDESAQGAGDASATATANGGTPPYSYSWTGPNGFSSDEQNLTGLSAGAYSVTVTDANGCSVVADTEVLVNVGELGSNVRFAVYPNPSNAFFYLNIEGLSGERAQYSVLDATGRLVDRVELNAGGANFRETIDLSHVQSGIYFLQLTIGEYTRTVRLVKQG